MTVGDRLLAARQAAGLTQQDVADRTGVTKQTIYKYENNIITNIPMDRLVLRLWRSRVRVAPGAPPRNRLIYKDSGGF